MGNNEGKSLVINKVQAFIMASCISKLFLKRMIKHKLKRKKEKMFFFIVKSMPKKLKKSHNFFKKCYNGKRKEEDYEESYGKN